MLKPFLRRAVRTPVIQQVMGWLEHAHPNGPGHLQVLTYHDVSRPDAFAEQVAHLAAGYDVLAMPELLDLLADNRNLPPRALLITFDDAYRSFAEVAWPVLRHYGLPATLFVPTAYPDNPQRVFWWETLAQGLAHLVPHNTAPTPLGDLPIATARQRHQSLKQLKRYFWNVPEAERTVQVQRLLETWATPPPESPVLGWDELRALAAAGVTLGAHTRTHPHLGHLDAEQARCEIAGSLADLRQHTGAALPIFAYPGGYLRDETVDILRACGVRLAFTTRRGSNDMRDRAAWLRLRRNNIGATADVVGLRARLLHASPYLNAWHSPKNGAVL